MYIFKSKERIEVNDVKSGLSVEIRYTFNETRYYHIGPLTG